jgi:hypothetical protein
MMLKISRTRVEDTMRIVSLDKLLLSQGRLDSRGAAGVAA